MNKISVWGVCLLATVILSATIGVAEENSGEMCVPMGTILLEPPASVEAKRSSVEFPHAVHFGLSCQDCHHTWTGETPVQSCSTSGCHDLEKMPRIENTKKIDRELEGRYYKKAYHSMCIGCHKETKLMNEELEALKMPVEGRILASGPTGCIECHPKDEE